MKVQIDKIGDDGLDLDQTLSTAWLADALGKGSTFQPVSDGRLRVHLVRAQEDVIHVRGRAAVRLAAECSRCLGPVSLALDTPIEVTLFPRGQEPPAGAGGELADDDMGVATYDNREIDLSNIVHDEVFLELPMSPVCSESCAGLCPHCGQNLNEGSCECAPPIDPRWGGLRRLKLS